MTEAGEKWACEVRSKLQKWPVLVNEQTDIMLRAFCAEVKERADHMGGTVEERFYDAFTELKRELLGGDHDRPS